MSDIIRYHKSSGEFTRYPEDYNFNLETSTDITNAFELEYGIGSEQLGVMEDDVFASFKEELTTELGYTFPNDPYEGIGSIDNTDFPLAHGQLLPHLSGKLPPEHIFRLGQGDWDAIAEIEDNNTRDYVWNKMQGLHELNAWNKPEEYEISSYEDICETITEVYGVDEPGDLDPAKFQEYVTQLQSELSFAPGLLDEIMNPEPPLTQEGCGEMFVNDWESTEAMEMVNDFTNENWILDDLI